MPQSKLAQACEILTSKGYTHIASIVKSVYSTSYYHVVAIDDIGQSWPPAQRVQFESGAHGRHGIDGRNIDWGKTFPKAQIHRMLVDPETFFSRP